MSSLVHVWALRYGFLAQCVNPRKKSHLSTLPTKAFNPKILAQPAIEPAIFVSRLNPKKRSEKVV